MRNKGIRESGLAKLSSRPIRQKKQRAMVPATIEEEWKQEYDEVDNYMRGEMVHSGAHDKLINVVLVIAQVAGTLILWFILSSSAAQLLSGFKKFDLGQGDIVLAYIAAYTFEFFNMALVLVGGRAWAGKKIQSGQFSYWFCNHHGTD